jgi:hypothetical protein
MNSRGLSVLSLALALFAGLGCSRAPTDSEITSRIAQDLGSGDSGTDAAKADGGDAGTIVPTACVVAVGALQIGDRSTFQADIAGGSIKVGTDSKYTGNAFSAGAVSIGDRTTIGGTLAYAGVLTDDNTVTIGALDKTAVAVPAIGTQTFTVGATVINVANGGSQTIAPGAYAAVTVGFGAHATFSAGTYRMASLLVDSGATVRFNASAGAILLRVQGAVTW